MSEKPRVTKFHIEWDEVSHTNENNPMASNMMTADPTTTLSEEGVLSKGSQFKERSDMMSSENLERAA